jgi:hypothetical protein
VKLRGSLMLEVRRRARAPLTIEQRFAASGPGAVARQEGVGDEPVLEAPIQDSSPETGGYGLLGCSVLLFDRTVSSARLLIEPARSRGVLRCCAAMPPGYSWAPTLPTG